MGAAGSVMVSQAFVTLTSIIAFLVIFFSEDFEPKVATSLEMTLATAG